MNFNSTVKGSLLEGFYPEGWDFEKIDACCSNAPETVTERQDFWNKDFNPIIHIWIMACSYVNPEVTMTVSNCKRQHRYRNKFIECIHL